MCENTGLGCED